MQSSAQAKKMRFTQNAPQKFVHLISLGCTKNLVDSEVMLGALSEYGITPNIKQADVVIINTCGFIESAKQESISYILQAASLKKESALLVVSGCLSQRYFDELKEQIPEIDIITGVGDFDKIALMIESKQNLRSKEVFLADNHKRVIVNSSIHAYIKLSEGCNQQCSFCAIPSFKGKLHSRSLDSVIKELQYLYNQGFRDFSFIAQDSSSFGRDYGLKDGLVELIKAIDKLKLDLSCRILYLYPSTTSQNLISHIAKSPSFLPYFDMPLQHISNKLLKRMNRGDAKNLKILLDSMKRVESSFIRTSFIIGHPGESEEDFLELRDFIRDFKFDRINIFEYSPQENTKSYEMSDIVDKKTITKRINELKKIIKSQQKALNKSLLNKRFEVIVEGRSEVSEHFYSARARLWGKDIDGEILVNDIELEDLNSLDSLQEGIYMCEITQVKNDFIFGKIIDSTRS